MAKKIFISVICLAACVLAIIFASTGNKKIVGDCTEYNCDVKNLRLSTTIEINKGSEKYGKVSGNILRFVTDPLTMYDMEDNKKAYADDSYHIIAQDSHMIITGDDDAIEMVGLIKIFGEEYDIYDKDGNKIAHVTCNTFNTNGEMYDANDNLVAEFTSKLFYKDFDVRITENCTLSDDTVLMIFCSYYSDQIADSK